MDTKIILSLEGGNANLSYEPALEQETLVAYINNALNTMPHALLNMYSLIPVLRPASQREQEANVYVFNEGDKGEVENSLYKYRKHLYDATAAVFNQLLATAFPDIEYIEGCKRYQQEFCMSHNEEETSQYAQQVSELTDYVREHFDEILKEVSEHDEQETE